MKIKIDKKKAQNAKLLTYHMYSSSHVLISQSYTHRRSHFDWCVGLSYLIQKMKESSPLKTASPISIV